MMHGLHTMALEEGKKRHRLGHKCKGRESSMKSYFKLGYKYLESFEKFSSIFHKISDI